MIVTSVPKPPCLTALVALIVPCLLAVQLGGTPIEMAQAKRSVQPTASATLQEASPTETPIKTPPHKVKRKKGKQTAQVTAFELEPPANPDYPAQLCGKRRERLVELQTMPWIIKPFFLGERRIEQWQYRLCLSKTMPEVQRYLESFPVPYTVTPPEN